MMKQLPVRLPYRFLLVSGPDAKRFLQGQSSIDIDALDNKHYRYGTLNTPKGRIYALFRIVRIEKGLLLCVHESTYDAMVSKLNKYAAFFKCELSEVAYFAYGFNADSKELLLGLDSEFDQLIASEAPYAKVEKDSQVLLKLPTKQNLLQLWTDTPLDKASDNAERIDHWHASEATSGIPEIYGETIEKYILQELNLQKLKAVSFTKGCYTGQEIIARMKYLGKQKKQMYLLTSRQLNVNKIKEAKDIYLSSDSEALQKGGSIVRIHRSENGGIVILAVLNKELINGKTAAYLMEEPEVRYSIDELNYDEL